MNWLSVCTIGFMSTANEKYSMKTADAQQASIGAKLAQVTLAQKIMAAIGIAALVPISGVRLLIFVFSMPI
jgi:hypothetical protein